MKKLILALAVVCLCASSQHAWACACGCGIFDVGTSSMFPGGAGGTAWLEYDYMNQSRNWSGTSRSPAAANDDKDIRSSFYTAGAEYMFNRDWGVKMTVPYWDRHFTTDDGLGVQTFHHSSLGDVRLMGVYTGFSDDMSSGLLFGTKLPTGDYNSPSFDRDTALGTGSTDALLGGYHMDRLTKDSKWSWFVQANIDVPVLVRGGYRPGSEVDAAIGTYYEGFSAFHGVRPVPVLQAIVSDRLRDSGPASDSPNSGYRRALIAPGLELNFGRTMIYADAELPFYEDVNGNQLVAPASFKVVASYHL